ncbi:TPM domain-containing protein [Microbacterium sulfonylureivorans]|uniref:TPM domain-containing protein n=1 Tax=Microbacterium sulfonylureivorans TaxID=2486854 RepID=UPI000FDAA7FB|nr:TPM domain-containing protein [Microbacterium sulfonylureivorans]
MRARWAAALTATLVVAMTAIGAGAWATDPVQLGSAYVLDQTGALGSDELAAAEAELTDLSSSTEADLYVVFVDAFTDPSDSEQWATIVAQENGLGPSQYLLAVSTEGRQYYLSADSDGPLSEQEVRAAEAAAQPFLREGDYAGAITATADSMRSALGAGGGAGAGGFTGIIWVIVIAAVVVLVIWLVLRSRRKKSGQVAGGAGVPAVEQLPIEELERRAASALVQTDDAIKTSAQELGFARAQFGDAATTEFEQALATAKTNLDEAFTLKQQLDDATPDSDQDVRGWNTRIVALCEQANALLDEKAEAFDELRKLEQNAPEALARIQDQHARAAASLDGAAARLQTLRSSYAAEALATVADNPDQARQRLAFADEQLAAAQASIGAGKGGEAAVGIRAAEEAVGQAVLLEDAIGKLADDLAEGERSAAALVAELEQDVVTAQALPDPDGRVAAAITATAQQIDAAKANLASSAKRPLVTLQSLEAANRQIDALVQGIRDAEAQTQRARQMVGQLIMQAQAQVSTAEDYITARRGAVGAEARTRLAEAGAALVRAQQLQADDPQQAMQHAQRADQLAGQAIQLAQGDVGSFEGGGMFGGGQQQGGGGGNVLGAVLGGILINSMMGGGGGRSSGGGSLGGMFGGGSSGGVRPGSFGGGGTRARRGGGRF